MSATSASVNVESDERIFVHRCTQLFGNLVRRWERGFRPTLFGEGPSGCVNMERASTTYIEALVLLTALQYSEAEAARILYDETLDEGTTTSTRRRRRDGRTRSRRIRRR